MISEVTNCNTCGGALDASRYGGRCARCLFAEAFDVAEEGGPLGEIGGHELIEEIARGGMGVVYRARQQETEREVALKTMRGAELDSPAALVRFRQEAKAMAGLEHPAILPVFTVGEQDGIPYFTMKLARGGALADRLKTFAGKWREIAELVARVADAVQHAHTHAILHRDLKPANILFDENGEAFVSDFGLAKLMDARESNLTHTTAVLGTVHYLAAEVARQDARAATTASDVWSLGVILYELLAQRRPFDGESMHAVLRAIIETEPAPLREVPRDLAVIALKALAKEPARRYASASALADDLRRWLGGRPILARPVSPLEKIALWARRNPTAAVLSASAVLLLVAAVAGIGIQWQRAEGAERIMRERLAHEHIRTGLRLAEGGDALRGLPHYVEGLRLGLGDPARERVARMRFETAMRLSPRLAQLWLPEQEGEVQMAEKNGHVVINSGVETRVWDGATGEAISVPMRDAAEVRHVWTDGRGGRVVTGTREDQITVWRVSSGTPLVTMPGEGHVRAVLGGERLRLAVLRREANTIICLSAVDGVVDATFSPVEKIEWAVASPNGTRILAATDSSLLLWDVASRALVVPPVEFGSAPDFGNFDPTGRFAGLRTKHRGSIANFDLTTGAIVARSETKASGSIRHGWLDASRWVVLTRKLGGSTLRDGATGRLLFEANLGARTVAADFAAVRNVFALAGENGASQLWDADAGLPLTPRLWADGRLDRVALSPDSMTVLISSTEPAARLWKLPAPGGVSWSADGKSPALAVWWDAGGKVLRALGNDARLSAYDENTGQPLGDPLTLEMVATRAVPDGSGRFVFLGTAAGARWWNAETGQPAGPPILCDGVRELAVSVDGRRAAVLLEKETLLCDPAAGTVQHTLATDGARRCLLSADGARLATISREAVQLWDAATGAHIGEPIVGGGKWSEAGARFDAAGRRLAVWWSWPDTQPGHVRVIDPATGREILPRLEHASAVNQAAFSATGDLLATGTGDQRLWVWRVSDGRRVLAPIQHDDRITDVGFSPDGLLVWSRSNRALRIWETATGDAVSVLHHRSMLPMRNAQNQRGAMDDEEMVSTTWSVFPRMASCDTRGGLNVWDFGTPARSLAEMEALARVLSMHRIESGGGLVPLTREELRAAWVATHQR